MTQWVGKISDMFDVNKLIRFENRSNSKYSKWFLSRERGISECPFLEWIKALKNSKISDEIGINYGSSFNGTIFNYNKIYISQIDISHKGRPVYYGRDSREK